MARKKKVILAKEIEVELTTRKCGHSSLMVLQDGFGHDIQDKCQVCLGVSIFKKNKPNPPTIAEKIIFMEDTDILEELTK
jgi:hypothetical protein